MEERKNESTFFSFLRQCSELSSCKLGTTYIFIATLLYKKAAILIAIPKNITLAVNKVICWYLQI